MTEAENDTLMALDMTFEGSSTTLNDARTAVADCLAANGFSGEELERAKLVASELTTNAVEASPASPYRVQVVIESEHVDLKVANRASSDALPPKTDWGPDDVLASRGRGLAIVEALCQAVHLDELADGWLELTARLGRTAQST